jgi:hypothetical protein
MYTNDTTYNFSMTMGLHVYESWKITKQNKFEKIMHCPSIKSPLLWYGSGFFRKKGIIMHSLLNKWEKTHFLNEISSKNF